MYLFSLFIGCGDTIKVSNYEEYCQQDPDANLIAEDLDCDGTLGIYDCDDNNPNSTTIATDSDCDTFLSTDDCDDNDPSSTTIVNDADCDTITTEEDCNDNDASSTIVAEDADCDGTITAEDCDDSNADSTILSNDADCDGITSTEDCDDADDALGSRENDADCDGVIATNDCDDNDVNFGARENDSDCDGLLTAEDCDDSNPSMPLDDADCDGTMTNADCDDSDPNSTILANDADCDTFLTTNDCNDNDPNSTIVAEDADCDGTMTNADCNDNDPNSSILANDADCDTFLTTNDCDDNNPAIYPGATDTWYDGIDSDCAGDNDYDQDGDGDMLEGEEGCSLPVHQTESACTSNGGTWSMGYDCNDANAILHSLPDEDDPTACYIDTDDDGFGNDTLTSSQLSHGLLPGTDCDDNNATTFPGAGFNEASPYNEMCLDDFDGDGYAAPLSGECFDFAFESTVLLSGGTITSWPINRSIKIYADGDLLTSKSSSGTFCIEEGRSFSFQYSGQGFTNGGSLNAVISWERENNSISGCYSWLSCYTEYSVNVVSSSTGFFYYTTQMDYINNSYAGGMSSLSQSVTHGAELYSGTTVGNTGIFGTDSNDNDASVH